MRALLALKQYAGHLILVTFFQQLSLLYDPLFFVFIFFPSWLLPYIKPSAPFNGVVAGREECGIHQVPEASQASRSQPLLGCTARFWRRRCYSRLLARRPISGSHWATQLPRLHLPVWRRTMAPHSGTHMTRTSCAFLVHTVSAIKMTDKKI